MRMLGKIGLPLAIALIAAIAAIAARALFALSAVDTVMAAAAVFCCLMVLAIYSGQAISSHLIRKRLSAVSSFDSDIVRRLDQIERDHPDRAQFASMDERLDELEDKMLGQMAALSAGTSHPRQLAENPAGNAAKAAESNRDWSLDFENENVVRLVTGKESDALADKNHKQYLQQVARSLDKGTLRIKLQPVIDLLSRKIAYVEAVPCVEIDGMEHATRSLLSSLDTRQKAEIDHFAVFELARVCRAMDEDSESAGIFYRFHCPEYEDSDHWQILSRKLKSDHKLAERFIAVIAVEAVNSKAEERLNPLFSLAELDISIALAGIGGTRKTLRHLAGRRYSHLLAPASALLSYLPGTNRRTGEEIVPGAARAGSTVIATDITERHQATGLLDLDVPFGTGDLISPPRSIRLYSRADEAAGKANDHSA